LERSAGLRTGFRLSEQGFKNRFTNVLFP
jgi:hypothetical protein